MASDWRETTIGALCDEGVIQLQTGPFGSQLHAHDYVEDGVPVVPTEALRARRINHAVLPKVSPAKAAELSRHRLLPGDILFASRGVQATGHIGCVRAAERGFICGTGAIRLRVRADREVDADFLSHVLADPSSVEWLKLHAIGATMPNLNEGIIRAFPLHLPPRPEQRAIAHILGTLDDKIELNHRMIETLEAMARALFQSWFVDFEPVRAEAGGRDSSLPKAIADLFPSRLVDSELGGIPEGWKVGTLADLTELLRNPVNPLESPATPFRHFSIPAFDAGQWPAEELGGSIRSHKWRVEPGVVLLSKLNPEIERVWLPDVTTAELAVCSTEFLVLRPHPSCGRSFIYCLCRSSLFRQEIEGLVTGTSKSHQRAPAASVLVVKITLPNSAALAVFEREAGPLLERALSCRRQARVAAALREALLPKLLNGEVRVPHSQHGTGSAAT